MLKTIIASLLVVLSVSLHGCATGVSGLKSYVDSTKGYQFLYPNGWQVVEVGDGPDVVLHDIIERTENVSVVISPVPENQTLADLGTPSEVGYQLQKNAIAPPNSNRTAELVNAQSHINGNHEYYLLEYEVKLPNQNRHDIASVAVSRGKLFTLNASTTNQRWRKVHDTFEIMAKSFSVY
ncbi:MAG: photosystem II reaction center PsbP family protein [Kastovskya adunca ATA6-11-RM4]|jgi:photosystem II oxygen-evolving enhancer protein 2|nr:photosystem II reaction center PsbP family protein [Kastovskya adunca ATA6-11-RM4]